MTPRVARRRALLNGARRPSRETAGLVVLLLAAFMLRLPGVWQDLPYVFHWDEPTLVNLAVWIFTEGSLNLRYFNYPGGMIYMLAVLFGITLLCGRAFGVYAGLDEGIRRLAEGTYPRPPTGGVIYRLPTRGVPVLYLLGRLASAALGTLSVFWAFRLGKRLAGSPVGWLAGALLASNALHASNSALVTTDVGCGAFLTWFLSCLFSHAPARRTGIALGLAAAFKYTGGIGLYLWPLGLILPIGSGRREWNRYWLRLVPWAAGTFLVLNPYVLLTPRAFLQGFVMEAIHMRAGTTHFGEGIGIGPTGPTVVADTLWRDLGALPLFGFAFAWITAFAARRRDAEAAPALLLGSWCLLYLAQLCSWKTVYARYLLPIWPALAVVAAWGWTRLVAMLSDRALPFLRRAPAAFGLTAAVILPGLIPLVRSTADRLRTDPRVEMSRVIERMAEPSSVIAIETGGPWVDPDTWDVIKVDVLGRATAGEWRLRGVRYLVATGREAYLPDGSPESLRTNRAGIEREARALWRKGACVLYDLGEGSDPFNRARRLLGEGRAREARDLLEGLTRSDTANVPAVMLLGDAGLALADTLAALDCYRRASRIAPDDPVPFLALGNIALGRRRWEEAVQAFQRAMERSRRDPVAAYNLSTALLYRAQAAFAAGGRDDAARDLNAASILARLVLSLEPEEPRFRDLEAKTRDLSVRWGIPLAERP